ncbi:MAG: M23 family metallopeptidase [Deltaproteobacteria bacterium]|nr:M23 family metallopeptidase [Deltaproteobacteria bacterium]
MRFFDTIGEFFSNGASNISTPRFIGAVLTVVVSCFSLVALVNLSIDSSRTKYISEKEFSKVVTQLASAAERARVYEENLYKKGRELDAVLDSVLHADVVENFKPAANEQGVSNGLGGGDEDAAILTYSTNKLRRIEANQEVNVRELGSLELIERELARLRYFPIGYPVHYGNVISGYGKRTSPFTHRSHKHHGVDIPLPSGTPVYASADGEVVVVGYQGSYGRMVVVDHGNGFETRYAHLSSYLVKVGAKVSRGDKLGLSGSSGRSTGPHLHYEVRLAGKARNPFPFMRLASLLKSIQ